MDGSFHVPLDGYFSRPKIYLCPVECIPDSWIFWYVRCYDPRLYVNPQHTHVDVFDPNHVVNFLSYYYLLCLSYFLFLLPCFPLLGSIWGITTMMRSLNLLKVDPWFGLFRKPQEISPVGHHSTEILPLQILSVTKSILYWCVLWIYCSKTCHHST